MRKLDRISLKDFKSVREAGLELRLLNVLIGANGAGKSNFISAFRMLNQLVEGHLQSFVGKAGGADALLHFGHKNTDRIAFELTFGENTYRCALAPSARDTLVFEEEVCLFAREHFSQPHFENLGGGHREIRLGEFTGFPVVDYVLKIMRDWKVYHFHDTGDTARVKKTGDINDNEALRADVSNLAAFLYRLRGSHPAHYKKIVQTVRLAAPFFDDFTLSPSRLSPDKIRLEWRERDSDVYLNASALSDGTLRFMCLATLLMQPAELLPLDGPHRRAGAGPPPLRHQPAGGHAPEHGHEDADRRFDAVGGARQPVHAGRPRGRGVDVLGSGRARRRIPGRARKVTRNQGCVRLSGGD